MVRIKRGNRHQGDPIFAPFNGMQCAGIALVSLLFCMLYSSNLNGMENMNRVDSSQIDDILFEGTSVYGTVVSSLGENRYLGHNDLPTNVDVFSRHFSIAYMHDHFYDRVGGSLNRETGQT